MKPIESIKIQFDPKTVEDKEVKRIFENETAKILWCCIRANHITDQYFNTAILNTAKDLEKEADKKACSCYRFYRLSYAKFEEITQRYLSAFGHVVSGIPDSEYWYNIYRKIIGEKALIITIEKKDAAELQQTPQTRHAGRRKRK